MILDHISKKYGKREILRDISMELQPGTVTALLGENGCGKSTLLTILAGIQKCDTGAFLHEEQDLLRNANLRRRLVGYVPQGTPLMEELTAEDHLKLWYAGSGRDLKIDLEEGMPALLGIPDFLKVPVKHMSGGMRKRLTIACATAHDPAILLMDEPTAALDPVATQRIANYMEYRRQEGAAILLVTHTPSELELCDFHFILKNGVAIPYDYHGDVRQLAEDLRR